MFSDKACSLICRSFAVLCTWMHFLSLVVHAIIQPIGMALNRSMQSSGKQEIVTCRDNDVCCLDGDGSKNSHLFVITKATCNSCACFGWDTQACIQAIGTRGVSSKWVSRYASDLEGSSLSTFTKTGAQQVTWSFHILGSGSCTWIRDAWVKYLFWGNSDIWMALFYLRLETTSCPQTYPIDRILFLNWQQTNLDCLWDQPLVRNSLWCLWVDSLEGTKSQQNRQ